MKQICIIFRTRQYNILSKFGGTHNAIIMSSQNLNCVYHLGKRLHQPHLQYTFISVLFWVDNMKSVPRTYDKYLFCIKKIKEGQFV